LVESWSNADEAGLVFLPKEVVGTCVNRLDLPWHLVLVIEVTALPDPSAQAVFGAQSFIYEGLFV